MQAQEPEPEGEQEMQGRTPLVDTAHARLLRRTQGFGGARPCSGEPEMLTRMGRRCLGAGSALPLPPETGAVLSRQV